MKVEIDFPSDFETSRPFPLHVGRLACGGFSMVRIAFTPKGYLVLYVPQSAVDRGGVVIYDDCVPQDGFVGFGLAPAKKAPLKKARAKKR